MANDKISDRIAEVADETFKLGYRYESETTGGRVSEWPLHEDVIWRVRGPIKDDWTDCRSIEEALALIATMGGAYVEPVNWYMKGYDAQKRDEPLSNAPRTKNETAAPEWRRGWLDAQKGRPREPFAQGLRNADRRRLGL